MSFIEELAIYIKSNGIENVYIKPIPFKNQDYIVIVKDDIEEIVNYRPVNSVDFLILAKNYDTGKEISTRLYNLFHKKYNFHLPSEDDSRYFVVLSWDNNKKPEIINETEKDLMFLYQVQFKLKN